MAQGIIFFNKSFADLDSGASYTISNNENIVENMFDRDPFTKYISTGSNDTDIITLNITFEEEKNITDIILNVINLKEFTINYWDGLAWVLFDTTSTNEETTYRASGNITTSKIQILMEKTIIADSQKEIQEIMITSIVGQFKGYPTSQINNKLNSTKKSLINGRNKILYRKPSVEIMLGLKSYMGAEDRELVYTIAKGFKSYLIWLCGGDDTVFSNHADEGWRLQDIYLVAVDNGYKNQYTNNYYKAGMNTSLKLLEVG